VVQQDEFNPSGEIPVSKELPMSTYTGTYSTADGYQQTVTVTVGPVIIGSDAEAIVDQWAVVGGTESPPCYNVVAGAEGNVTFDLRSQFAGYAFGTIAVTNDVPEFPVKDWPFRFSGFGPDQAAMGIQYSNGALCEELSVGADFAPVWKRDDWGPVPFAIAVAEYSTPANPSGDVALLASPITVAVDADGVTGTPGLSFELVPLAR
jgi:hypothetical protein